MQRYKFYFVLFLIFFIGFKTKSQNNRMFGSAYEALGGAGVTSTDIWASSYNQAGLSEIRKFSAGAYFSNTFNIPELALKAFAVAIPAEKYGTAALSFYNFGYELYSENKFALAYSKKLGKRFAAGVQIDYFYLKQGLDYGNSGLAVGEIGILAKPTDKLFIAAHFFNPTRTKYNADQNIYVKSVFKLGTLYKFTNKFDVITEAEKDIDRKPIYKAGFEYDFFEKLILRTGVNFGDEVFPAYSFGIGYGYKNFNFDVSFTNHQILGFYSHFSVSFAIRK